MNDLELMYLLDEQGYYPTIENLKILKEGLETGKFIVMDDTLCDLNEDLRTFMITKLPDRVINKLFSKMISNILKNKQLPDDKKETLRRNISKLNAISVDKKRELLKDTIRSIKETKKEHVERIEKNLQTKINNLNNLSEEVLSEGDVSDRILIIVIAAVISILSFLSGNIVLSVVITCAVAIIAAAGIISTTTQRKLKRIDNSSNNSADANIRILTVNRSDKDSVEDKLEKISVNDIDKIQDHRKTFNEYIAENKYIKPIAKKDVFFFTKPSTYVDFCNMDGVLDGDEHYAFVRNNREFFNKILLVGIPASFVSDYKEYVGEDEDDEFYNKIKNHQLDLNDYGKEESEMHGHFYNESDIVICFKDSPNEYYTSITGFIYEAVVDIIDDLKYKKI